MPGTAKGNEMDIKQMREAKIEMENSIQVAVIDAMRVFYAKTGVHPEAIHVHLVDVTQIADREKRYMVGDVHAEVRL